MQDRLKMFYDMRVLTFVEKSGQSEMTTESKKQQLRDLIVAHRASFPGILTKVSYRCMYYGDSGLSDPTMMLLIRDAMNGDWSEDSVILHIPQERDEDLVRVLEDTDLSKRLKSISIYEAYRSIPYWDRPLSIFLSRYRDLDSVEFSYISRPELLSWAFEEQQAVVAGVMAASSQVQWKLLAVLFDESKYDLADDVTMLGNLRNIWKYIVVGLGHCLVELEVEVEEGARDFDIFPYLSLPDTSCFPKLQSLSITYPRFSKIAYTGIERLRKLSLVTKALCPDANGHWQDWRHWKSLESLYMDVEWRSIAVIFNQRPFSAIDIERIEENIVMESGGAGHHMPNTAEVLDEGILPALRKVKVHSRSSTESHLRWLLLTPNISELIVWNEYGSIEYTLVAFFEEAAARSLVFPNLKKIVIAPSEVDAQNCFLSLWFIGLEPGIDMFPALENIILNDDHICKPRCFFRAQSMHSHAH